jgi:hypothetical protein
MSSDFRRVALIAAALGLLVSLYFALRPDDEEPVGAGTTAVTTTAPATTETQPPATDAEPPPPPTTTAPEPPDVVTIRINVPAGTAPEVRRLSVRQGRQVKLVVSSELTDHVHVHGYDLMADVAPHAPATIEFTASAPGRFEIELEDKGLQIAELEVRT